ncbi:MAG: translation elongation factor Ts [Patescibacteria group bacterium]
MARITIDQIKQLRAQTGAPIMECRTALEKYEGDEKKAQEWIRAKGLEKADKKAQRKVKSGLIEAYTHTDGRIGVLVEVGCETDFVSRNEEFKNFVHELCLQVAAMNPESVDELLKQPWIRDETKTIEGLVKETISRMGENIKINRFQRFELGIDKISK